MNKNPTVDAGWNDLYKIAGWGALVLLAYSLATLGIMVATGGQPDTVEAIFAMLRENRLVGLLRLDLLTVLVMPLYYVLFLGFLLSLWRVNKVYAALSAVMVFAGVTLFLATPSVFSYLLLSDRYAAAATDAARAQLLAAGEAIYASDMWRGTGAQISGLLTQGGAVIVSALMLRAKGFGKAVGIVGLVTHGLDLLHVVVNFFSLEVAVPMMYVAGPLYLAWFPMVARCFWRMGREEGIALAAG